MFSHFSRFRLLVLLLASTAVLAALGCSDDDVVAPTPTPAPPPFSGAYAMENWSDGGITGGTTSIDPDSGSTATAAFSYDVQLGGGGVAFRTASFEVPVPKSGSVTFDWVYTGFHAWCCPATVFFRVFADGDEYRAIDDQGTGGGSFTFSGTAAINVSDTGTFGFEIGGQNFDLDSRLLGTLTITNFRTP